MFARRRDRIGVLLIIIFLCSVLIFAYRDKVGISTNSVKPQPSRQVNVDLASTSNDTGKTLATVERGSECNGARPSISSAVRQGSGFAPKGLFVDISRAADLRVFAESVRSRPAEGGLFYERQALARCREVRDILSTATDAALVNGPSLSKTLEARSKLQLLCGTFIDSELSERRPLDPYVKSVSKSAGDPLLTLKEQSIGLNPRDPKFQSVVDGIVKSADPFLIRATPLGFNGEGFTFEGTQFRSPSDVAIYVSALELAGCYMGEDCGRNDFAVTSYCAATGQCLSSRVEVVKSKLSATYQVYSEKLTAIEGLAQRIATAVLSGTASVFLAK